MPWNPEQYERFRRERELPFADALALVGKLRDTPRVIDLGCGTGALTTKLADAFPEARVLGIDTSAEMLVQAKQNVRPHLRFVKAAIEAVDQVGSDLFGEAVEDPRWDLIFSHAALHWVAEHSRLVPRLFRCLAPGGRLVVQVPSNYDSVAHTTLRAVADESPFRESFSGRVADWAVLPAFDYAEILWRQKATDIVAYEKVYPHEMPDSDAVVEWIRGTVFVPYLERLPRDLHGAFTERVRSAMRAAMPDAPLFYGFKRTLFAATRAA